MEGFSFDILICDNWIIWLANKKEKKRTYFISSSVWNVVKKRWWENNTMLLVKIYLMQSYIFYCNLMSVLICFTNFFLVYFMSSGWIICCRFFYIICELLTKLDFFNLLDLRELSSFINTSTHTLFFIRTRKICWAWSYSYLYDWRLKSRLLFLTRFQILSILYMNEKAGLSLK